MRTEASTLSAEGERLQRALLAAQGEGRCVTGLWSGVSLPNPRCGRSP